MAFLDNSGDIILDAVLTDTGRFRLAKGDGTFKIAKFALGDDEIEPGGGVAARLRRCAAQGPHRAARLLDHLDEIGWWCSQCVGDHHDVGSGQDLLHLRDGGGAVPAHQTAAEFFVGGHLG